MESDTNCDDYAAGDDLVMTIGWLEGINDVAFSRRKTQRLAAVMKTLSSTGTKRAFSI